MRWRSSVSVRTDPSQLQLLMRLLYISSVPSYSTPMAPAISCKGRWAHEPGRASQMVSEPVSGQHVGRGEGCRSRKGHIMCCHQIILQKDWECLQTGVDSTPTAACKLVRLQSMSTA